MLLRTLLLLSTLALGGAVYRATVNAFERLQQHALMVHE